MKLIFISLVGLLGSLSSYASAMQSVAPQITSPADNSVVSSQYVHFQWTFSGSFTPAYYVLKVQNDIGSTVLLQNVASTSLDIASIANGIHHASVKAVGFQGQESPWSEQVHFKRTNSVGPPGGIGCTSAPKLLSPANLFHVEGTHVPLKWSHNYPISYYRVVVSRNFSFTDIVQAVNVISQQVNIIGLDDGEYYWKVRGVCQNGDLGNWSVIYKFKFTFKSTGSVSLGAPTLIEPSNNASIDPGTVTFKWSSVTNATMYQIQLAHNFPYVSNDPDVIILTTTNTSLPINLSVLSNGQYQWKVRAQNSNGFGPFSSTRSFSLGMGNGIGAPSLIAPLDNAAITTSSATFSWTTVTGAVDYRLQISQNTEFTQILISVPTTETSIPQSLSNLNNGTFFWRVRGKSSSGQDGPWSEVRDFNLQTGGSGTSLTLIEPLNDAIVTTTNIPFKWQSNIVVDASSTLKYKVQAATDIDFQQIVKQEETSNLEITINGFGTGAFFWRVIAVKYPVNSTTGEQIATSEKRKFTVDTSKPLSTVSTIGFFGPVNWPGGINGTAQAGSQQLQKIQVRIKRDQDGKYWNGTSFASSSEAWLDANGTSNWSYTLEMTNLEDGKKYKVTSKAFTVSGLAEAAEDLEEVEITIDKQLPTSTILTSGNLTNNTYGGTIDINASDNTNGSGLQQVKVRIKRSSDGQYYNGTSWQSSSYFDLTATKLGALWKLEFQPENGATYTINSKSIDAAANEQNPVDEKQMTYTLIVSLDSSVSTQGSFNSTSYPGTIQGTATGTGLTSVQIQIKKTPGNQYFNGFSFDSTPMWLDATGSSSWSYGLTLVTDGSLYVITSRAVKTSGNSDEIESGELGHGEFIYDTSAPEIVIQTQGYYSPSTYQAISGTIIDQAPGSGFSSGIKKLQISIQRLSDNKYWKGLLGWGNGESMLTVSPAGSWTYDELPLAELSNGVNYKIIAKGEDNAGNKKEINGTFMYDSNPPTTSISGISAAIGAQQGQESASTVNISASDQESGVELVEAIIKRKSDGKYWNGQIYGTEQKYNLASGNNSWSVSFQGIVGSQYEITARSRDKAGNYSQLSGPNTYTLEPLQSGCSTSCPEGSILNAGSCTCEPEIDICAEVVCPAGQVASLVDGECKCQSSGGFSISRLIDVRKRAKHAPSCGATTFPHVSAASSIAILAIILGLTIVLKRK